MIETGIEKGTVIAATREDLVPGIVSAGSAPEVVIENVLVGVKIEWMFQWLQLKTTKLLLGMKENETKIGIIKTKSDGNDVIEIKIVVKTAIRIRIGNVVVVDLVTAVTKTKNVSAEIIPEKMAWNRFALKKSRLMSMNILLKKSTKKITTTTIPTILNTKPRERRISKTKNTS